VMCLLTLRLVHAKFWLVALPVYGADFIRQWVDPLFEHAILKMPRKIFTARSDELHGHQWDHITMHLVIF
jgi:hypothetical protein